MSVSDMQEASEPQSFRASLESLKTRHAVTLISATGFLLYVRTLFFSYTYCDDNRLIVLNQEFLSHLSNIPKLFTKDVFLSVPNIYLYFRPLLNLSFMLDAQVSGDAPWFYHLTNVFLHVIASLLVFVLFRKLYGRTSVATSAALIFSVHPLLTYAVAWIPGRNDSLFTVFLLSSFIFFLRSIEWKRTADFALHLLFFGLALLTKETAAILPAVALMYVLFVRRGPVSRKHVWTLVGLWAVILGGWLYARTGISQSFIIDRTMEGFVGQWIARSPALLLYLGKAIFPFNLSVFPNLHDVHLWWGVGALIVIAMLFLIHGDKDYRLIVFGLLWFFLFLAPSIIAGNFLPEHRAYSSFVGLLIALYQFPFLKNLPRQKSLVLASFGSIIIVLVIIAFLHSENFSSREAFCFNAYQESPSIADSYSGLAGMYLDQQDYAAAERVLLEGLARYPNIGVMHRMLGDVYVKKEEFDRAEKEYRAAIRLEPLKLQCYVNYGRLCLAQGRLDETERLWKTTVEIQPDYILGYYLLANFFLLQRDDPDSAAMYTREIQNRGVTVMPELLSNIANRQKGKTRAKAAGTKDTSLDR